MSYITQKNFDCLEETRKELLNQTVFLDFLYEDILEFGSKEEFAIIQSILDSYSDLDKKFTFLYNLLKD